jgi:hypothetical protein
MTLGVVFLWASYAQACWVYQITINGITTFSGVAGGPLFSHTAFLVLTAPFNPAPETNNGVNALDVGIFTITGNPFLGVAGALYFATNTSLSEAVIGTSTAGSNLDLAFVTWAPTTSELFVALDGDSSGLPHARFGVLNIYNSTTSVTAQIHNILTGTVLLQFSNNFSNVAGNILFGGSSGFGGPFVSSEYRAAFSGLFLQSCQ